MFITAKIAFILIHIFIHSSNMWLLYIPSCLFTTSRVYLVPTWWSAPTWPLVSLESRLLHRYHKGHGFKSRTGLNIFSGLIFTTPQVVFITVKMAFIFKLQTWFETPKMLDFFHDCFNFFLFWGSYAICSQHWVSWWSRHVRQPTNQR